MSEILTVNLALHRETEARQAYRKFIRENEADSEGFAEELEKLYKRMDEAGADLLAAIEEERRKADTPAPKEPLERATLQRYIEIAGGKALFDGAEKELNSELGLDREWLPIDMLLDESDEMERMYAQAAEERADAVTTISESVDRQTRPIAERVFAPTIVGRLGVSMPSVRPGEQQWAHLTEGATAGMVLENEALDTTAGQVAKVTATPLRMTTGIVIGDESLLRVGSNLEAVLKADMRKALGKTLSEQVLKGNGTLPNLRGILTRLTTSTDIGAQAATGIDWKALRALGWQFVDDIEIDEPSGVTALFGLDTMRHGHSLFDTNIHQVLDGIQALESLRMRVLYSSFMPVKTGNAGAKRQTGLLVTRAQAGNVIVPVWRGIRAHRFYDSQKAQNRFDMNMFLNITYIKSAANRIFGYRKLRVAVPD